MAQSDKEYPEYGIHAALSTDNPCAPGIMDVFGYIQVLVNGYDHSKPINEDTVQWAFDKIQPAKR